MSPSTESRPEILNARDPRPGGNPVIRRLHAATLGWLDRPMHRIYGRRKERLLADLPAELVEIGPGVGANFRYYPPGTRVIAVEPNPAMHRRLRETAERRGLELEIRGQRGEELGLDDACTEVLVSTLVLCSVTHPQRVLEEVRRVLVPGGRFVFIEHVAAPRGSVLRKTQERIRRPWRFLFDGCHLQRETWVLLEQAGFSDLDLERFEVSPSVSPVRPHIAGRAVR